MIVFTQIVSAHSHPSIRFNLALTAEQRTKTRQYIENFNEETIYLRLPRGTILNEGDILKSETEEIFGQVIAQPEPVITVTAQNPLDLLKAAYHLGNRHVPLEISPTYLRFSPDPVLCSMLLKIGLILQEEVTAFYPERGAYGHH